MKLLNRKFFTVVLAACLAPVLAWSAANPGIQIRNGYVRGLPPGSTTTSAYMTLVNSGDEELVLTGATTPVANSVSIHKSVRRQGGVMAMEPVMSAALPAHGQLVLETGGMHLMLMGLNKPLRDGITVEVTLQFEGGISLTVDLPVVSVLNE